MTLYRGRRWVARGKAVGRAGAPMFKGVIKRGSIVGEAIA